MPSFILTGNTIKLNILGLAAASVIEWRVNGRLEDNVYPRHHP